MTIARRRRSILISGGGITGLTTALCLARSGYRSEVFEKAEGFDTVGAGIQVSPNALHVLDDLGLSDQLKQVSVAPSAIRVMAAKNGAEISRIPLGATAIKQYGLPYLVVHRADLHQILVRAVNDDPDISLHLNSRLEDIAVHANGVTGLIFEQGQMKEFPACAMIAADGVWSKLRVTYFGEKKARYSGLVAWRGLIATEQLPGSHDLENIQLWLARNAHAVSYPVRNGRYLNVVVITKGSPEDDRDSAEDNWTQSGSGRELEEQVINWNRAFRSLLKYRTRWTRWPLFQAPKTKSWVKGPAVLAGDAAHAMLPFAAQGAVMGIEDAAVLGKCLAQVNDGRLTVDTAMQRYQAERRPRVLRAVRLTQANRVIYHLHEPLATMRNLGMALLGGERLLARQDWLYNWQAD